jgi:transposase
MVTTWGATTGQILALREHLVAAKVTCVVIESTSDYWNRSTICSTTNWM